MVLKRRKPQNPKTEVKEKESLVDLLSDEIEITLHAEVKSSVEYISVGCSASLKTTLKKEDLEETSDKLRKYLRERALKEHSELDKARSVGITS